MSNLVCKLLVSRGGEASEAPFCDDSIIFKPGTTRVKLLIIFFTYFLPHVLCRENTLIAHTYVQIARMSWSAFESALDEFPKDRHVWHYVKGVLQPLVLSLKSRILVDLIQHEKHEEAVERYINALDHVKTDVNKTKGFISLKKKFTGKWRAVERIALLKGYFPMGTYLEETWEWIKLLKTIAIIWLVPLMWGLNETKRAYTVTLGVLSLIGFSATFMDWHRPFWHPKSGNMITSPPMIFHHWFRTSALQHLLMKFPFDLFFILAKSTTVNGVRLLRLLHIGSLIAKLARQKAKKSLKFGLVMQVN